MITLVLAFLGAVVAAVGTGVLAARSVRSPRADLIAWTIAMLGLAIGLGAVAVGCLIGFGPASFRAMELAGQVLAPLALALGLAELAGKSVPARFAGRLLLPALAVIAFAVLSTDTLTPGAAFSKTWPNPTVFYETVSNKLLEFALAPAVALVAVIAIAIAALRRARDPAWRNAAVVLGAAGAAALALAVPGLVALLGGNFGVKVPFGGPAFAFLGLAAAALTFFAGLRACRLRLDLLRGSVADDYDDNRWDPADSWAGRPGETGDYDPLATGEGVYRGNGLYRDDPASDYHSAGYPQGDYDLDSHDLGGRDAGYPGSYLPAELDAGYPAAVGGAGSAARSGVWQPAGGADPLGEPDRPAVPAGMPPVADHEARDRMFGQIAIYTLLEARVDDFDRLTEQVVEQVQTREPDTLVYIVHAVPSAPLQRILYEVYRDRAAYDQHRRQPYVARFEADRRPYVLATNVIELGLQQAKVSPFPSIADILDQTGAGAMEPIRPGPVRSPGPPAAGPPGHSPPAQSSPAQSPPGYGPPSYSPPGYGPPSYSPPGHGPPGYSPTGYPPPEFGDGQPGRSEGPQRQR
jgi:quinol monooxygenase YgiN